MDRSPTPDEQPKRQVARRVTTQKRKYFVPAYGRTVEATSAAKAASIAKALDGKKTEGGQ
jgi:hypothetical protein